MRILVIDNFDSFTYNLVHDLERIDPSIHVEVVRNNELKTVNWLEYNKIVLSPGPGLPNEAGDLMWAIQEISQKQIPILGVCLGLQALVELSGGSLYNLKEVRHGESMEIVLEKHALFFGIQSPTRVGLYHSWAADLENNSDQWHVIGKSVEGVIMALEHKSLPWIAFQFHPESVLSKDGRRFLENWVKADFDV